MLIGWVHSINRVAFPHIYVYPDASKRVVFVVGSLGLSVVLIMKIRIFCARIRPNIKVDCCVCHRYRAYRLCSFDLM